MRSPEDELLGLEQQSLRRHLPSNEAGEINFAANDYLGLSHHPQVIEAFAKALTDHGAGATASRLICGGKTPHHQLETLIAESKGTQAAITFANGYSTSVGVLTAVLQPGDTVVLDKLCHASLIDGARMSGATIRVFPHNHLEKLTRLLQSNPPTKNTRTLVVTESVFSMDGDLAELQKISALCQQHGALLMVDEAHALGVIGPNGMGLCEQLGLNDAVDFHMGTLGKAAGVAGGYLAAKQSWIDLIVNRARSLIYSTAPPPAQAAAAAEALRVIRGKEGRELQQKLWQNIRILDTKTETATSAIVPKIIGDSATALGVSAALRKQGFIVPAIRYPTVARDTARLRITLSAAHQPEDVKKLRAALDVALIKE